MSDGAHAPVRILSLDNHALFRESVARFLASEPGFEVVAHSGSSEEALALLRNSGVDIILLDLDLGQADGKDFLRAARKQGFAGRVRVVIGRRGEASRRFNARGDFWRVHEARVDRLGGGGDSASNGGQNLVRSRTAPCYSAGGGITSGIDCAAVHRQGASGALLGFPRTAQQRNCGSDRGIRKCGATLQQLFAKTGVRTRSQLTRIALEKYRDQL